VGECPLRCCNGVCKCHNMFAHFRECDNEHFTNSPRFLWQYNNSALGMLLGCPITFDLAMMIVLTSYVEWSILLFLPKILHDLVWLMMITSRTQFTIFNLLIQHCSVACSSTIATRLCIIAIIITWVWHQTAGDHQFHYVYYYYYILTKPWIK